MFAPNQRVKVNLSNLKIQGVLFSQNVQEALGTILEQTSTDPSAYRVEVPEDRIQPA